MPVELHPEEIPLKGCKSRENDVGGKQYLIGDIFDAVRRSTSRIHSSYATMAITMSDIYPGEEWNYVFGQARLDERVGVFSFARHSPFSTMGHQLQNCPLLSSQIPSLGNFTGRAVRLSIMRFCTCFSSNTASTTNV